MADSERIEFMHSDDVRASTSQASSGRSSLQLPPPYNPGNFGAPSSDGLGMDKVYPGWQSRDPRSSSTHSLVPSLNDNERRRTLLIVYIHGFMGNDSSFRSFPAHVHSYLKETLQETHVIHSKIYPRYKTYKSLDVARDNFSKWLEPHESPKTDVVLIGHSMGGLLAADIVLIVSSFPHLESPFIC
jgi:pimeloyl-ACP methyl ester carboxylesterase